MCADNMSMILKANAANVIKLISRSYVLISKLFEHKIINNFLPIHLNMCLGAQNNRLIETVLFSNNNICFR